MAEVNPLYVDGFFFYSAMYDDTLLSEFFNKISAEAYSRATYYQHNMIGRVHDQFDGKIVYTASCGDLTINKEYNRKVGIPLGSYTVKIPYFIIPFYDKKRFVREYGYDNCIIPIKDFYTERKIFHKYPVVHIGPHRIMSDMTFILNRDRSVTLVIPPSKSPYDTATLIDGLDEDDTITIFLNEHSRMFSAIYESKDDTPFTNARQNTVNTDEYYLTISYSESMIGSIAPQVQHKFYNSWDLVLNGMKSGTEVFSTTAIISLVGIDRDNDQITFLIPKDSLDALKSIIDSSAFKVPFSMWIIERPNRRSISAYEYNPTESPILNLKYNENPAGNINIEIYECDEHYHKGRRLYDANLVQLYFPNIFDFTSMNVNNSDLLIEVIEYPSTYTHQVMNNSLTPLVESLGEDFFTEFIVNGYDVKADGTSLGIKKFHPQHYGTSFEDYTTSPYYKNIRGYLCDKLCKMFDTDPWLVSEYYQFMNRKNPRVFTTSGTPKKFKLTMDGTAQGEYSAAADVVMDTSCASQNSDDVLHFTEPHTYLRYRSNEREVPSMLYFNGRYVKPTTTRFWNGLNYIFIPTAAIKNMKTICQTNQSNTDITANGKLLMESCSPITLDIFPNTYASVLDVPSFTFTIESMDDVFRLFNGFGTDKISINDILFYEYETRMILKNWRDLFDISIIVDSLEYDIFTGSELIKVEKDSPYEYLLTLLKEIYSTSDEIPIILNKKPEELDYDDVFNEFVESGTLTKSEADSLLDKKFYPADIVITPKDVSLIGMTICAVATNYKKENMMKGKEFEYVVGTGYVRTFYCNVDIFPEKTDNWTNFMVFKNGQYIYNATVEAGPFFNGEITLTLPKEAELEDEDDIIFVHLPIRIQHVSISAMSNVKYMKPGDKTQTTIDKIWPSDTYYENGLVFQAKWSRDRNPMLPLESDENAKFTHNGFRLPPMSKSTYNARSIFYDANRMKYMSPDIKEDLLTGDGVACALPCAISIDRWESHRSKDILDNIW